MKPFPIYHTCKYHFATGEQRIMPLILEIVKPDAVFLLGATLNRRRAESIFSSSSPSAKHISDYFLLVLINDLNEKQLYEWQDHIEQNLKTLTTVTVIVLETITFQQWLNTCHPFAVTVAESSVPLLKNDNIQFLLPCKVEIDQSKRQRSFREGVSKSKSFLAGAELYFVRKEYKLAAFMLHQATEQALFTIIKAGVGYHAHTHNIDRLLRYSSMVCYQMADIFPRNNDREKQLYKLLQNAYSEARYSELYAIGYKELHLIMERVKEIVVITESLAASMKEKS